MKDRCPVCGSRGISYWQKARFPWSSIVCKSCETDFRLHRGWRCVWAALSLLGFLFLIWLCLLYVPWPYTPYAALLAFLAVTFSGIFIPVVPKEKAKGVKGLLEDWA